MARLAMQEYMAIIPAVLHAPRGFLWSSYDEAADVLYVNFKKPSHATDSEMTDDDVIIRYEGKEIVGLTILNMSKREPLGTKSRSSGRRSRTGPYR